MTTSDRRVTQCYSVKTGRVSTIVRSLSQSSLESCSSSTTLSSVSLFRSDPWWVKQRRRSLSAAVINGPPAVFNQRLQGCNYWLR